MDIKLPELPVLVSGMFGGPFTIFTYTPLRNAITLGAQDTTLGALGLYKKTFQGGLHRGWTGGVSPTIFSCPQFVAMGPLYHVFKEVVGPNLAVIPTAFTESVISYGSQARNAQMAYNITVPAARQVPLHAPYNPIGIGFPAHVTRNMCAMSGIRVLTVPCQQAMELGCRAVGVDAAANRQVTTFLSDFVASVAAAAVSMPFNQLFNFLVTEKGVGDLPLQQKVRRAQQFLQEQYLIKTPGGSTAISRVMLRDVFMRCAYIAPQLSTFVTIERFCIKYFGSGEG